MATKQQTQTHYRVYLAGDPVTACGRQVAPVAKVQAAARARALDWAMVPTGRTTRRWASVRCRDCLHNRWSYYYW